MTEQSVVRCELRDRIAVLTLDNPPVNGLSHAVRSGLKAAFERAIADPNVDGIVLTGAGRGFSAGGDIREFGTPAHTAPPGLSLHLHPVIESSPKVTVAAIHGIAMGGGLETALVCHYRVASGDTKVALPEVKLGIIPLSGTQRLPRVLGLAAALDFIVESKTMLARDFAPDTLFDVITDDASQVLDAAVALAKDVASRHARSPEALPLIRHRPVEPTDVDAVLTRARSRAGEIGPVAVAVVDAISAAVREPTFDAGMQEARAIFDRLSGSAEVVQRREAFFASRTKE